MVSSAFSLAVSGAEHAKGTLMDDRPRSDRLHDVAKAFLSGKERETDDVRGGKKLINFIHSAVPR